MTAFRGGRNPKSGLEPREKHDLGWSEQLGLLKVAHRRWGLLKVERGETLNSIK